MIQITHVGSLPFLEVKEALEFSFSFDIPALFTLPNRSEKEFLGQDIVELMKVEMPFYYNEFKEEALKRNTKTIKYQIVGPITLKRLYPCFKTPELLRLCKKIISNLQADFNLILAIDEPYLFKADELEILELKSFILDLKKYSLEYLYIHSCSRLSKEQLESLRGINLNLNQLLYLNEKLSVEHNAFFGFECDESLISSEDSSLLKMRFNEIQANIRFMTPACGLALKRKEDIRYYIDQLKSIRDKKNYE